MLRTTKLISAVALLAAGGMFAGCQPNWALLVRPVPPGRALAETVIRSDPGLFVGDKIAVVDLDGLLMNQRASGLMTVGENPVSLFVEKVDRAAADPAVKAVVLRINSPGGGVAASDILYSRVLRMRQDCNKPVVAFVQDLGASGAYYVACSANEIYCMPTSVVGSIGVIIQTVSFAGTMDLLGIKAKAVTSGQYKDMGNPFKPLSDKDLALFQGMVDEFYGRFVSVVDAGRPKLTTDQVRKLADGRVYTGGQALELGLVDGLCQMDKALARAKQLAGVRKAKVVLYHRPYGYAPNAYAASGAPAPSGNVQLNLLNVQADALLQPPQFLYLWTGGAAQP